MHLISGQERGQREDQVLNSLADRWDTPTVREDRAIGKLWAELANGTCRFVMGKSRLSIRLQPPYSEERRQKMSENARKNGFTSPAGNVAFGGDMRSKFRLCTRCFDRKHCR